MFSLFMCFNYQVSFFIQPGNGPGIVQDCSFNLAGALVFKGAGRELFGIGFTAWSAWHRG